MSGKSERKRIRKELVATYRRSNPTEGYDGMSKRVNESYAETQDIRQTMRETRLPFDFIWEMLGFKDEMDFIEMGG
jgi:hypothetical protein